MRINPGRWPIAWRITGALIALTVASVATVSSFGFIRGRDEMRNLALESIARIAEITVERIEDLIEKTRNDCHTLSDDESIIRACVLGDERSRKLATRQVTLTCETDKDLSWALLASPDGKILATNRPIAESFDVTQRRYFQEALKGEPYVSGMLAGRISGEPGVFFSHPVRQEDDGPVIGVVMIKLDGRQLRDFIQDMTIAEGGYAMLSEVIVPGPAVIIAHPDNSRLYTTHAPLTPEQIRIIDPMSRWNKPTILSHPPEWVEEADHAQTFVAKADDDVVLVAYAELEDPPWRIVAVQPESEFLTKFEKLFKAQVLTVLAVLAFACLLAYVQSRSILRPVRQLTLAAESIARGDLDARANIQSDDELGRLARVFDDMVPQLRENLKLQQSLSLAAEVQAELLPAEAPAFPGLDVAGASLSYEQIGGDYYDYIDLRPWGDERFGVAVGDIVGHGIAAAMLMATARAHVRSRARPMPDLGQLFNEVNARLADDLGEEKFMTLALYVFAPERGRIDWISAGQDPAFHYRAATGEIEEARNKNVPLGVVEDWDYKATSRDDLAAGDVLLIGTDGIWELRNHEREEFGKQRVRELLSAHHGLGASEIVAKLLDALEAYRGDLPRQDDVTVVVIRVI